MENQKKLPIKLFAKRKRIDERKTEGGGSGELPTWAQLSPSQLTSRLDDLREGIDEVEKQIENREPTRAFIPQVMKVKIHEKATAKSHRAEIASLFNKNNDRNLIGLTDSYSILIQVKSKTDLLEINKKLNSPQKYLKGIASVLEVKPFKAEIIKPKEQSTLRVSLINYHNYQLNQAISFSFETLCASNDIVFKKVDYSPELIIYKLDNATLDSLDIIEDFEAIESIAPMPLFPATTDELSPADPMPIPVKLPNSNEIYPIVGVLDTGIEKIPHLAPWIHNKSFSKVPKDYIDNGHGTFVSGIIVYPDELEQKGPVGSDGCYLLDATIFPDAKKDTIMESELIEHIREAIEKHHDEVKIWNLSLGTSVEADLHVFSYFGRALDQIQERYNVIICKSAGNCLNFRIPTPVSRISNSADSVRSIVVGSLAHNKRAFDIADVDNPSPFSRIGKGPASINKPDLTQIGGNAGIDPISKKITKTGVTSFSPSGDLVTQVGTSFSTPRITSLLAGLSIKINEPYNPLLLKALAIHNAKYPSALRIPQTEKIKYVGYGLPSGLEQIIYNDPYEITLVLQDSLIKGNWIEIPDFPFPQSLEQDGYYYGEIILTLVSSPRLSESQGSEYCQSNLEVRMGTYDKLMTDRKGKFVRNEIGLSPNSSNILLDSNYAANYKKNFVGDFARERTLIKYGDKYQPVKKYAVNLEEMTAANKINHLSVPKRWYLQVEGFYRDFIVEQADQDAEELSQDFCLIVTIRDNKRTHQVYDLATKLLNENGFIHSNINIRDRVQVNVSNN